MDNIRLLEERYLKAKIAYYEGNPFMSDSEFDALESHLKSLGSKVHEQVGSKRKDFDFAHPTPMLSLAKIQTEQSEDGVTNYMLDDFFKWYNKCVTKAGPAELRVAPKFDGNAINCIYQGNKLVNVLTRGDGTAGKDITDRIKLLIDEELVIEDFEVSEEDTIEIRCEVVIDVDLFNEKYQGTKEEGKFANARNYVAGVIGKDEYDHTKVMELTVIPLHWIVNGEHVWPGHFQKNHVMNNTYELPMLSMDYEVTIKKYETIREEGYIPYQLDGVVISFPNMKRAELGENDHDPEWAIAIKFIPEETITSVEGIEWNISKRGEIIPTLLLKPVFLDGSTVGRASGYNASYLLKNCIGPGAMVSIAKAGDIIPEVQKVVTPVDWETAQSTIPKTCPYCGEKAVFDIVHAYCSDENCKGRIAKQLAVAVKVLDLKGIGEKTIEPFAEDFKNIYEVLQFTANWGLTEKTEKYGLKDRSRSQEIFCKAFENIKSLTYEQVIQMLGYDNVGKKISTQLAREHAGLDYDYAHLEKALVAKLRSDEVSDYIKEVVKGLEDLGISIDRPGQVEKQNGSGVGVCLTGSPKEAGFKTKKEFLAMFPIAYEVSLSDKNCRFLVTDSYDSTSSKMKTAEKKGISIVTYEDFESELI